MVCSATVGLSNRNSENIVGMPKYVFIYGTTFCAPKHIDLVPRNRIYITSTILSSFLWYTWDLEGFASSQFPRTNSNPLSYQNGLLDFSEIWA